MMKPQTVTLAQFESDSKPGTYHQVKLGKDDKVYCTCRGWKYHRHCWHLQAYRSDAALKQAA